ncbi:hypothetical protein [Methylomonas sp. AM2-LC]|uniref:hypothetical protein n=1 Tax=Methylomonas sp. AM2-LC TaxID=3153301 RepID=UPI0032632638
MSTLDILATMVNRLENPSLSELGVIPWAAPVISFGNLSQSKIATLGLNPSNREFVDLSGIELDGHDRRFHTLRSLGLNTWSDATDDHLHRILDSCNNYFYGNPYDGWFRALDRLIIGTSVSYYGIFSEACHLDLVPYATACKWGELTSTQKATLLNSEGDALGLLLRESSIEVIVLNGQSVIENLQMIAECTLKRKAVPDWTLPRRTSTGVTGYAYTGKICKISGVDLGREISVLGYSHNIQSSYGVTTQVKTAIQQWITNRTSEVFVERSVY